MSGSFSPADVQIDYRPGIVDFTPGHPPADLLPAGGLARATAYALEIAGPSALGYGRTEGPASLVEPLRGWLASHDDEVPPGNDLFVTGGISQALDLICTLWTAPGDVVLVESPVYHLALRIFRDHGLNLVAVPADGEGLRSDALAGILRGSGRSARFLYTVPTYNNPAGHTMPLARRREVAALATEAGLTILEDDAYRYLWYGSPPPPPIQAIATPGTVIRLGSFSKIIAPGLRLGWLTAEPSVVRRLAGSGLVDSGGGQSHTAAHVAGAFIRLGLMDEHLAALRSGYAGRRDALLAALDAHLPSSCTWSTPGGGFFAWLSLPENLDSADLLPIAEANGVSYVPGERFCCCGGCNRNARLAFTLLPIAEMEEGARRLARALVSLGTITP